MPSSSALFETEILYIACLHVWLHERDLDGIFKGLLHRTVPQAQW